MRLNSVRIVGLALLAVALILCVAGLPGSAQAETIDFNNSTGGSSGGVTWDFGNYRWQTMYSGGGHLHQGGGNTTSGGSGSPGLSIHDSCCSTPYKLFRLDGARFDLLQLYAGGSVGTFKAFRNNSEVGSVSIISGYNTFNNNSK